MNQQTTDRIVSGGPAPEPGTLNQLFFGAVEKFDRPDTFQIKSGKTYQKLSDRVIARRTRHIAAALGKAGVEPGDRVAIISENRPEWALTDYACLTAGIIDVPIYPTLPAEQIEYVLRDSGTVVVFASTAAQVAKIASLRSRLPALRLVVSYDTINTSDMHLDAFEAEGARDETEGSIGVYRRKAEAVKPDDLATIIYTSGTTGLPKGVMLSHNNIYSNVTAASEKIPLPGGDVSLSFLPLSHVFQRVGDYLMFSTGGSIVYVPGLENVPASMEEARPTLVFSVPRLYEKMYARVLQNALAASPVKRRIFFWARGVGESWADVTLSGGRPSRAKSIQYDLAKRLVFSKVQARTGGRLRYFISGAAPLAPEINRFFYAAGLTILEGYGLTETSPVISVNTPEHFRIGTVGKPIRGVDVLIANDGEILTRGPCVMKGYYNNQEATAETIDSEGWLHTGDIGEIEDGFLRITDRKKDIIVTAGGKNIAPQPIENRVKTNKYVTQAVMIGDKRKFPIMLIVPNFEQLEGWARKRGLIWSARASLLQLPEVQALVEAEVKSQLEGLARYETPKKIALLPNDFSIERDELTPTQKVKRRVIDRNYKDVIDRVYGSA